MGWIRLDRKILDEPYYFEGSFDRVRAWVDLLLIAEHKDGRKFFKQGRLVEVNRGEIAISENELAKRWKLSRNTVRRYLAEMESDKRLHIRKSHIVSILKIVKYAEYQNIADDSEQLREQLNEQLREQPNEQPSEQPILQQDKQIIYSTSTAPTHVRETSDFFEGLTGEIWQEQVAMLLKTDVETIRSKLPVFRMHCQTRDKRHENLSDCRSHFQDWLRIQLEDEKKQVHGNESAKRTNNKRRGFEVTATSAEDYHTSF